MNLERIYERYYPTKRTEFMDSASLMVDLLLWCRQNREWIVPLVENAANISGAQLKDAWYGSSIVWGMTGYKFEDDASEEGPAEGSEAESPHVDAPEVKERADVFTGIMDELRDPGDEDPAVIVNILAALFSALGTNDFFRCGWAADAMFHRIISGGRDVGVIRGDEFYEYDELLRRLEIEHEPESLDKILREIGYDPTTKPTISGEEFNRWIDEGARPQNREEEDADEDN